MSSETHAMKICLLFLVLPNEHDKLTFSVRICVCCTQHLPHQLHSWDKCLISFVMIRFFPAGSEILQKMSKQIIVFKPRAESESRGVGGGAFPKQGYETTQSVLITLQWVRYAKYTNNNSVNLEISVLCGVYQPAALYWLMKSLELWLNSNKTKRIC